MHADIFEIVYLCCPSLFLLLGLLIPKFDLWEQQDVNGATQLQVLLLGNVWGAAEKQI